MKRILSTFLALAVVLGLVLFALLRLTPSSPVKADEGSSIVGTWINTVTVNGAPPVATTELISFNPGGTFTLTDSGFNAHSSENPFLPPPLAVATSDGYGAWRPQGDSNQFAITFKSLLFAGANTPPALYGPFFPGQNVGVATIEAVGTLQHGENGDTLAGPFTFQFMSFSRGVVVATASGTFSATRLKIEPLMP